MPDPLPRRARARAAAARAPGDRAAPARRPPAAALLASLVLASAPPPAARAGPPEAPGRPGPVGVGTVLPLSGPLAPAGAEVMTGMLVWIEEANARGGVAGRRAGLLAADGGGDPARTAGEVRALAGRPRVAAVVGVCCGLPETPPAAAGGAPVLFPLGGGGPGAAAPPWARFGPDEVAGFPAGWDEPVPDAFFDARPGFAPLRDAFRELHGRPPTRAALLGYAAMRGLAEAVEAAGGLPADPAALAAVPPGRLPARPPLGEAAR